MVLGEVFIIRIVAALLLLLGPLAPPGRGEQGPVFAVRCKYPWKRVRFTLGFVTREASLVMKSSGSNMT
jgi:hypothetical protein